MYHRKVYNIVHANASSIWKNTYLILKINMTSSENYVKAA